MPIQSYINWRSFSLAIGRRDYIDLANGFYLRIYAVYIYNIFINTCIILYIYVCV